MRINLDTPISELYHEDNIAYIDLDEGELMHWKYIKREKLPNGKWRYYYDESELTRYEQKATNARVDSINAAKKVYFADKNVEESKKKLAAARAKHEVAVNKNNAFSITEQGNRFKEYREAADDLDRKQAYLKKAERDHEKANARAQEAVKKYKTKKIISFPRRIIAKGAVTVANFLSKLGGD